MQVNGSGSPLTPSFFQVGDDQWIYREIRRANQRGRVDLSDTLFTELEQRGGYELVHRSGSF